MIKIYCGKTVQDKCGSELHPVAQVQRAADFYKDASVSEIHEFYSNSPDFVSAMYYIGHKHGATVELYLDGEKVDILDDIFDDFNKSFDLLNECAGLDNAVDESEWAWDCKLSPDKKCHYYTGIDENNFNKRYVLLYDGTKHYEEPGKEFLCTIDDETDDCCLFCGQPEERK